MRSRLTLCAINIVLMAGASSGALAQYVCPPGYGYYGGVCQPLTGSYSDPASRAISGEAGGATQGYSALGPVGAVVGGALGTATGALAGTARMVSPSPPQPSCGVGYIYYNGACYPAR